MYVYKFVCIMYYMYISKTSIHLRYLAYIIQKYCACKRIPFKEIELN